MVQNVGMKCKDGSGRGKRGKQQTQPAKLGPGEDAVEEEEDKLPNRCDLAWEVRGAGEVRVVGFRCKIAPKASCAPGEGGGRAAT